jgi:hypothetical protein
MRRLPYLIAAAPISGPLVGITVTVTGPTATASAHRSSVFHSVSATGIGITGGTGIGTKPSDGRSMAAHLLSSSGIGLE